MIDSAGAQPAKENTGGECEHQHGVLTPPCRGGVVERVAEFGLIQVGAVFFNSLSGRWNSVLIWSKTRFLSTFGALSGDFRVFLIWILVEIASSRWNKKNADLRHTFSRPRLCVVGLIGTPTCLAETRYGQGQEGDTLHRASCYRIIRFLFKIQANSKQAVP